MAPETDPIDVTVVTVTWNSRAVIGDFLESLPAALGTLNWRLVLADNASNDDTVEIARAILPGATYVQLGWNAGYAAGINAAVDAAEPGTHLLVANPDVILEPAAGERLLSVLGQGRVGIAVPQLRDSHGALTYSLRRDPTVLRALGEAVVGGDRAGRWAPFGETVTAPGPYGQAGDVDWASGAILAISRQCAARLGRWDETMWLYSEETDYCLRARDAGFTVRYVPEARAVHIGGESGESPMLWTALTVNRVRLFERRHSPVHTAAFRAAVTLNEGLRALAGRATSRAAFRTLTRSRRLVPPGPPQVT
ncbi:MAG: glycosyltransferase family 2 protein [Acidimicrobiales bacterium]|jgi:GT2 family glycosyltransferase